MPKSAHRYWLLEKQSLNVMTQDGDKIGICLFPGQCITLTREDPPPKHHACGRPLDTGTILDQGDPR